MTTPMLANDVINELKAEIKKSSAKKKANIMFQLESGHCFKIGKVKLGDDGSLYLVEAERYSAPIGFNC